MIEEDWMRNTRDTGKDKPVEKISLGGDKPFRFGRRSTG
jgi:hypothetical protein